MPRLQENRFRIGYNTLALILLLVGGGFYFLHFPRVESPRLSAWVLDPFDSFSRGARVAFSLLFLVAIYTTVSWHLAPYQKSLRKRRRGTNLLAPLLLLCFPSVWLQPSLPLGFLFFFWAYHTLLSQFECKRMPFEVAWGGVFLGIAVLLRPAFVVFLFLLPLSLLSMRSFSARNILAFFVGFLIPPLLLSPFLFPLYVQGRVTIELEKVFFYHPIWEISVEPLLPLWIALGAFLLLFLVVMGRLLAVRLSLKEEILSRTDSTLLLLLPVCLAILCVQFLPDYLLVASFMVGILYTHGSSSAAIRPLPFLYVLLLVSAFVTLYSLLSY